jgi:hypothetical protein
LLDYKATRAYGNVFVPRGEPARILVNSKVVAAAGDLADLPFLDDVALRVLTTYLDRWVARKERESEARHLEPRPLVAKERIVPYTIRVTSDALLREIEELLRDEARLFADGKHPLPRLHLDRHLFNPILLDPQDYGLDDLAVSPPGLRRSEERFVRDLREFWKRHHQKDDLSRSELFLLRNLPRIGIGFFRRSGFYPDFVIWLREAARGVTRVLFVEPHGMHHGGLSGNADKIEALKHLETLNGEATFQKKKLLVAGCIVTDTERDQIPGAEDKGWDVLERDYLLFPQDDHYIERILSLPRRPTR